MMNENKSPADPTIPLTQTPNCVTLCRARRYAGEALAKRAAWAAGVNGRAFGVRRCSVCRGWHLRKR